MDLNTDELYFNKYQSCKIQIKQLLLEIGMLQSEKDELKYELEKLKSPILDVEELKSIKQICAYKKLHRANKDLKAHNEKLKRDYSLLFNKYNQLINQKQ